MTATIRAWAKDNGWPDIPGSGRLPPKVREAFRQAHGRPVEPVDDVSEMDEPGDDELDGDIIDTEIADDDPFPPPADLDEARERAGRDPEAAHLRRGRRTRKEKEPDQPAPKVTAAIRRDIEGKVAFWLLIPSEPWMRVDPYCGKAYADSINDIAVKATPLLCQSPAVVRWFSKSTTFIQVTELAMACRPVAEAIIAHHVTKRIMLDKNGKVITDEQGKPVPAQTGGMDFSAYSARQPNPAAA